MANTDIGQLLTDLQTEVNNLRVALECRSSNVWQTTGRLKSRVVGAGRPRGRLPFRPEFIRRPRRRRVGAIEIPQGCFAIWAKGRAAGRPPAWTRPQASMTDYLTDVLETKIAGAQETAGGAERKADTAQTTADTAVAKAGAAQQTANTAVTEANAAQQTANTGVSRADEALGRTLKMHIETDVLRASQVKTFTLGKRILAVWYVDTVGSHSITVPVITGNVARVLVNKSPASPVIRILWRVLYEE